jgi:parvulin-like peptidyl-prolyl isomerase
MAEHGITKNSMAKDGAAAEHAAETATVLQVGDQTITAAELLPLLAGYRMLPQLLQEILVDQAIATIECTEEEVATAREEFYQRHDLTSDEARQQWLQRYRMTEAQLAHLATREFKVERYKQATWGPKLESYFLDRKSQLDKVIYSLIRVKDLGLAQEIYFRVLEGEQSFAELARTYSQGPEAQTDGLIGPVELSVPHPNLAQMLSRSQPGQLLPPSRIGEWVVVVRLERFVPAQLDEPMRRRLLNEFFQTWLQEQLNQVNTPLAEGSPAPLSSP